MIHAIEINGHGFQKAGSSSEAKQEAKCQRKKTCLISDTIGVVGCHLYSAGVYPELAKFIVNIFLLKPHLHTGANGTLDINLDGTESTPEERKQFLLTHAHPDHIGQVRRQLEQLEILVEGLNIKGSK